MGIFDWELRIKGLEGQVYGALPGRMDKITSILQRTLETELKSLEKRLEEKYLKQQALLDRTLAVVEKMADKIHTHAVYNCKVAGGYVKKEKVVTNADKQIGS